MNDKPSPKPLPLPPTMDERITLLNWMKFGEIYVLRENDIAQWRTAINILRKTENWEYVTKSRDQFTFWLIKL